MPKKTFNTKKLDMSDVLDALNGRSTVRLAPPVRADNRAQWDALIGALLMKRCDLIVRITDTKQGSRYERVYCTSSNARITQQLANATIEYVVRVGAATPKWASGGETGKPQP